MMLWMRKKNIWNEWMNRIRSEWVLFKIKIMFISTVVDINKIYLVYQCENSRFSVSFSSQNYSYFFYSRISYMYKKWWRKLKNCNACTMFWKLSSWHFFHWGGYVLNIINLCVCELPLFEILFYSWQQLCTNSLNFFYNFFFGPF